jgi:hypothetical protein
MARKLHPDEPTPEELAELNAADAPTPEELAELNGAPARPAGPALEETDAAAAGAAAQAARPPRPGFLARLGTGLRAVASNAAKAPGEFAASPAASTRALVTGAANASTLGLAARGGDKRGAKIEELRAKAAAGTLTPDDMQHLAMIRDTQAPPSLSLRDEPRAPITDPMAAIDEASRAHAKTAEDITANPGSQTLGALVAPSPGKLAGQGFARMIRGTGAVARAARPLAASATMGAVDSGVPVAARGGSAGEILQATGEGTATGIAAHGAGKVINGAAGLGRMLAGKVFPVVGRFAEARAAGRPEIDESKWSYNPGPTTGGPRFGNAPPPQLLVKPRTPILPPGREGIQAAGETAVDAIRARQQARGAPIAQAHADQMELAKQTPANLIPVEDKLDELAGSARFQAGDVRRGARSTAAAAEAAKADLLKQGYHGRTERDLVEARRDAKEAGAFGKQFPTTRQRSARKVYGAYNESVSPETAAVDDAYAANKRGEGIENRIVFGREKGGRTMPAEQKGAPPALDPNDRAVAGQRLARIHDKTEPGKLMARKLEILAARDPVFKEALSHISAKKALEETRFLGGHGTGEQVALHDAAGIGSLLKLGAKKAGAVTRKLDDRILRPMSQGNVAPFFTRLGRAGREEDRP